MSVEPKLEETVYVDFITSSPTTGAAADADSTPTAEVFEDATDTAILTPTVVKRTSKTGNYRVPLACTAANGFELGKSYNVVASCVFSSVTYKAVVASFQIRPAATVSNVTQVNGIATYAYDGTATAGGSTTITLGTGITFGTNTLRGRRITIVGGTGMGQSEVIVSNTNATPSVVTIERAWLTNPSTDSTYTIDPTGNVGRLADDAITASSIAADAITAAKIADGAIDTATFASGCTIPRVTLADTATTLTNKTGFSLTQSFPTNFSSLAITAGGIVQADVQTIKTNPVVNGGTVTFPAGATLASTTNITAGTITTVTSVGTVTNLTNAPTVGDFTSTMKTSLNASTPASIQNVVAQTADIGTRISANLVNSAGKLWVLDGNGNAIAPASTALTNATWTDIKATYIDAAISSVSTGGVSAQDIADAVAATITSDHGAGSYIRNTEPDNTSITAILTDTSELQTEWENGGRLDLLVDAVKSKTDLLPSSPAAVGSAMTLEFTQAIPTTNTAQTVGDALNAARAQGFGRWVKSGTTLTLYAANGTTVVRTFTLNDTDAPTSRT